MAISNADILDVVGILADEKRTVFNESFGKKYNGFCFFYNRVFDVYRLYE